MPKHLAALLSILGLAGSATPAAEAQVLKGSKPVSKTADSTVKLDKAKQERDAAALQAQEKPWKNSAESAKTKSDAAIKMHKGDKQGVLIGLDQPGAQKNKLDLKQRNLRNATPQTGSQALTKGNAQVTKGNAQITKGDAQITKGNVQVTKGNAQVTKGNVQITK